MQYIRQGVGVDHTYNGIYLRLFCMYGTHFYSGPIGMFCIIIFFYSKRRYMGLIFQYINPIEVLQYQ